MRADAPNLSEKVFIDPSPMTILTQTGFPELAEVYTARMRSSDDLSLVEFVDGTDGVRRRDEKWIINISTQFGCPVGCRFCDAGREYHGNLTAEEMLTQVHYLLGRRPHLAEHCAKLKIHFARLGEPSLNDAVPDALAHLPKLTGAAGLWACVATVAPAGRENWFRRLFEVKDRLFCGRFQLQFSMNTTCEKLRARLMPIRLAGFEEIADYIAAFHRPEDRKAVLNFALERFSPFDPQEIIRHFNPAQTAIKLTPLNPTAAATDNGLQTLLRSSESFTLTRKMECLSEAGFDVVLSIGDGREDDIGSNCGQSVRRWRQKNIANQ